MRGLCSGWILDYNLCEKNMAIYIHDKAYFNVLFGREYIVNGYHENGSFLGAANMFRPTVTQLNMEFSNGEKSQAHEELGHDSVGSLPRYE